MKLKALPFMIAFLICFLISSRPLLTQSKDKNNPTQLKSPEIKAFASPPTVVYWYKLAAVPGELVVEMEVECENDLRHGASAQFILYNKDMKEAMNEYLSVRSKRPGPSYVKESQSRSLILDSKQDFLLAITPAEVEYVDPLRYPGTYMIRFKGAIDLSQKESEADDD